MFQVFQLYVSIVSYGCYKRRSGCCMVVYVCCKCLSPMFHLIFYRCVVNVSNARLKCFIYLLLYIASVASECFKSRSRCCTCCNGVSTVCSKYFICFRRMLQMFHLDVTKVDQSVARHGRWLSPLLGRSRGSTQLRLNRFKPPSRESIYTIKL